MKIKNIQYTPCLVSGDLYDKTKSLALKENKLVKDIVPELMILGLGKMDESEFLLSKQGVEGSLKICAYLPSMVINKVEELSEKYSIRSNTILAIALHRGLCEKYSAVEETTSKALEVKTVKKPEQVASSDEYKMEFECPNTDFRRRRYCPNTGWPQGNFNVASNFYGKMRELALKYNCSLTYVTQQAINYTMTTLTDEELISLVPCKKVISMQQALNVLEKFYKQKVIIKG